ncbi:peptide ABC transporter substrate-binding protein [Tropicimonas sp. IMCC34043]|uniref:peptide ABC transporter substrate-binding protein n=1 Tax=Tropicimonas sp. IMCC34043 TaxID=2248760 RepID=UPI000E260BA3|nr:peptide ABC transporter substrate-binding protein [Tropicimonas sp. IMCC34043]
MRHHHLRLPLSGIALVAVLTLPLAGMAETVLNRGNLDDPESLDPHRTSTLAEANLMRDLFSGLMGLDPDAKLIPDAAASWRVSDDGLSYTFTLRADGKWSDGSPVTAADFVYSWRRVVTPETAAEYAYMLAPVKNAEAITAGTLPPEDLGIRAIDDLTLEVTLNGPTPYFLQMLTHQSTYPVQKANVEAFGAAFTKPGNLVSNGAYVLGDFVPNDHITLTRNPEFYDAANVSIDTVNYYPTADASAAVKRFEAGELDVNRDFPTEQTADLQAKFGDQLRVGPTLGTYYYGFKIDKAPWDEVALRQAISMLIDRDFLAEKVWQDTMLPAYSFVPPGIDGYESAALDYAGMSQIDREEQAEAILTGLGIGPDHPLALELRFNTSDNNANTAVAVQEMLAPFGIEVSLVNLDTKSHYGYLEQKGDYDLARAAWFADYVDPENFLALCKTGTGNNTTLYSDGDFDALLEKAALETDPAKRMGDLHDAEAIGVARDLCVVPLMFYSYHNLVSDRVGGWGDNVMDVHPTRFLSIK